MGNGAATAAVGGDQAPAPSAAPVELERRAAARAWRVVESETSIRSLVERLLGTTRIVRDLDAATAAWREIQRQRVRFCHARAASC